MSKVNPKSNSPARSLIQMSEWDQPDYMKQWDVASPTTRIDGNGLGQINDAPAVNSGSKPIAARDSSKPGSSGDPSEGPVLAESTPFNFPGKSSQRANLQPDGGIRQGFALADNVPWSSPERDAVPAIGQFRKSGLRDFPSGSSK